MNDVPSKQAIQSALRAFSGQPLLSAATGLLAALGYASQRRVKLEPNTCERFVAAFGAGKSLNERLAPKHELKSVDFVFQLTDDEIRSTGGQRSIFGQDGEWDHSVIKSYVFLAVELAGDAYSRTALAGITRELNKLFAMPALLLFKHGETLTLAVINRRFHKRDASKDVLEKVTLIKDIRLANPHRAHVEILFDLSLDALSQKHRIGNFDELHAAWRKTLDTSALNKRFYQELANWYFWALGRVRFPKQAPKDADGRDSLSLIRLITRVVFCWFLKEKGLLPDALFDPAGAPKLLADAGAKESTYYKAILQNLFFATLNQEMGKREFRRDTQNFMAHTLYRYRRLLNDPDAALGLFASIPFMNGGLFECLDKTLGTKEKHTYVRIDGFSDRDDNLLQVPNELFFGEKRTVDLSEPLGDERYRRAEVRGLIHILDAYKFTVAENTPIEEEVALDPELLGKVFENLLAAYNPETGATARKQTGSFYTPREIVDYMVDESLIACLAGKLAAEPGAPPAEERLRHLFAYNDQPHQFSEAEVESLIAAIDELKILDPACGSGAFPMGVLHKLVFVLAKLDPGNTRWKARQIANAEKIPDPDIRQRAIADIEQAFRDNELNYGRKLYLIENCIYGVDIQPIAVQISKLRFFISLIVDQRSNPDAENLGIRPLPNLETRFVAANTLIGIERPQQKRLRNPRIDAMEGELRRVRERHFSARTPGAKAKYREQDAELRGKIAELLKEDDWNAATAAKLASWDPYDQNESAVFFDAEWMFGVTEGFDSVIGNPPYVLVQNASITSAQVEYLLAHYGAAKYKIDLYHLFIEAGVALLSRHGVLCFITPNTFLKNKHADKLREILVTRTRMISVALFYRRVFEDPSVDNLVFACQRSASSTDALSNSIIVREVRSRELQEELTRGRLFPQSRISAPAYSFELDVNADTAKILENIDKGSKPFGAIGGSYFGIQTHDRVAFVSHERRNRFCRRVIDGGNVFRYLVTDPIEFVDFQPKNVKSGGDPAIYARPRIVLRQIGRYPEGSICPDGILTLNTIYNLYLNDPSYDLRYILAVVNSRLVRFYWLQRFFDNKETFPKIKKQPLQSIPIRPCTPRQQEPFAALVDKITNVKRASATADTSELEGRIDGLVYGLYELTPEEIATVEQLTQAAGDSAGQSSRRTQPCIAALAPPAMSHRSANRVEVVGSAARALESVATFAISDTDRADVLCSARQVFDDGEPRERESALRELSRALGYARLGPRIREVLDTDLLTAVRRGILKNERGELSLDCRSIDEYDRDFLKTQFLASLGRGWTDRDSAARDFARWLGFARTGGAIADTVRSLINGLLRECRLETSGDQIRKASA